MRESHPFRTGQLHVPGACLYFEEVGDAKGLPALYLHGGPGGAIAAVNHCIFDPERYRAVLFDQRGCGRSTPRGQISGNTTPELIADVERLRTYLGIDTWTVVGGSWGASLALAYAQEHPGVVKRLVLRGVFLARPVDIDWIYGGGAGALAPNAWRTFVAPSGGLAGKPLMRWYAHQLDAPDADTRYAAALACRRWSDALADPNTVATAAMSGDLSALVDSTRIKFAYFLNDCFLTTPNQLLDQIKRISGIPGILVHGARDMVCPLEGARALHRAWPGSRLVIVEGAGHAQTDPAIVAAIRDVLDGLAV